MNLFIFHPFLSSKKVEIFEHLLLISSMQSDKYKYWRTLQFIWLNRYARRYVESDRGEAFNHGFVKTTALYHHSTIIKSNLSYVHLDRLQAS